MTRRTLGDWGAVAGLVLFALSVAYVAVAEPSRSSVGHNQGKRFVSPFDVYGQAACNNNASVTGWGALNSFLVDNSSAHETGDLGTYLRQVSASGAQAYVGGNASIEMAGGCSWILEVEVEALTDRRYCFGFSDTTNLAASDSPSSGQGYVCVSYRDGTDTNWQVQHDAASSTSPTRVDSGVAAAAGAFRVLISTSDGTSYTVTMQDGDSQPLFTTTVTTDLPNANHPMGYYAGVDDTATGGKSTGFYRAGAFRYGVLHE